ncbi:MAG: neutral/alkaline non-lysosomal ceramidase N-terminal domain-containing protein [Anaerolineae bacterium]
MTPFRIGFAASDITPPVGTPLGGYIGRPRFEAQGVHDPLFAKAVALSDSEQLLLVFSLDLLGFTVERSAQLTQAVADGCGLEPEQVLLACTHTHSGPNTLPLRGIPNPDESYYEFLSHKLRSAGRAALAAQRPARMEAAMGRSHVGANRRGRTGRSVELRENPDGVFDDALLAARFVEAQSGEPLGVITSYGCHLTALGPRNMLISAEWAGLAMADLQGRLGCPCVFLNGAFGNVNPRGRDETWSRTEAIASTFAADCLQTLSMAQPAAATPVRTARRTVWLPLTPLAPEDEIFRLRIEAGNVLDNPAMDEASRRVAEVRRQYADAVERRRVACEVEESRAAELVGVRVGDMALIGMPGEIFAEYGIWVRGDSKLPYTMVLGNVGAEMGYFPTETAFSEGGYEPSSHIYFCEQGYASEIEGSLLDGARTILADLAS